MRWWLAVPALLLVSGLAFGGNDPEAVLKQYITSGRELHDVLAEVKDKAGADKALPRVKMLAEKYNALDKQWKAFEQAKNPQVPELVKKYSPQSIPVFGGLSREVSRVHAAPWGKELSDWMVPVDTKIATAKFNVKQLETATLAYKFKNQALPQTLEQVTKPDAKGNPAILTRDTLTDPWGRPYRYDPSQLSKMGAPLIWSDGPPPHRSGDRIANWEPAKK